MVNWFVGLAQIFAAHAGEGFSSSIRSAMLLYQGHTGAFGSSSVWFTFARIVLITLVTVGSLSPMANATRAGAKPIAVFVAILTLGYFVAADALSMWRLGVYIGLTEPEAIEAVPEPLPPPPPIVEPESSIPEATSPEEPSASFSEEPAVPEDWKPIAEN